MRLEDLSWSICCMGVIRDIGSYDAVISGYTVRVRVNRGQRAALPVFRWFLFPTASAVDDFHPNTWPGNKLKKGIEGSEERLIA